MGICKTHAMLDRLGCPAAGEANYRCGSESREAIGSSPQCVTSRNNVVHKQHPTASYPASAGAGRGEGPSQVRCPRSPIQASLRLGSGPAAEGSNQWQVELFCDWPGDLFRLVEAAEQVAAPVKRYRNDQVRFFQELFETMGQSAAEMRAQKWETPELQRVDDLDKRGLIGPAGEDALERGRVSSATATEIAIRQGVGFDGSTAARAHRSGCRLEPLSALRAQAKVQGRDAFDSIAGHADRWQQDRQQPKPGFLELGSPCL